MLLAAGASAHVRDGEGRTALHLAALRNDAELCQVLTTSPFARGADVNAKDRRGDTPLHLATRHHGQRPPATQVVEQSSRSPRNPRGGGMRGWEVRTRPR